jgi:hypothetical protein
MRRTSMMIAADWTAILLVLFGVSIAGNAQESGRTQNAAPRQPVLWNTPSIPPTQPQLSSAPAPRREISGTWDAFAAGIQPFGVKSHAPFTDWGKKLADTYKPGDGPRKVTLGEINDPLDGCDPAGFPRNLFFELRPFKIVQTPEQVLMLYEYQRVWRGIWTDGRPLPQDPEPRWYGYSVGHWLDDYSFVVDTVGLDERTWLDNAGDPHSAEMRVQEIYHRADADTLELTVKIEDPKAYTAPWLGLNKFVLKRQPKTFDIREMICAPSEAQEYKKTVADPASQSPQ